MLSEEQIKQIKAQLLKQIESWAPENRGSAEEQIESMNAEELEAFLMKNNMIKSKGEDSEDKSSCIFCSISSGETPSHKIAENKQAIAVLEINPISEGHIMVIPKTHVKSDKIPLQAFSLAKKVAEKIKAKLNPKKVDIITGETFEHGLINVLPVYEGEHLGMPRKKASEEQLQELESKLAIKQKEKKEKKPKVKKETHPKTPEEEQLEIKKLPKYPIRIP
jgi:histidine triad (HIT) family protein